LRETVERSIGPEKGMEIRGWMLKPSSEFRTATSSQSDGCVAQSGFGRSTWMPVSWVASGAVYRFDGNGYPAAVVPARTLPGKTSAAASTVAAMTIRTISPLSSACMATLPRIDCRSMRGVTASNRVARGAAKETKANVMITKQPRSLPMHCVLPQGSTLGGTEVRLSYASSCRPASTIRCAYFATHLCACLRARRCAGGLRCALRAMVGACTGVELQWQR
jgi:hypothetical protein